MKAIIVRNTGQVSKPLYDLHSQEEIIEGEFKVISEPVTIENETLRAVWCFMLIIIIFALVWWLGVNVIAPFVQAWLGIS